jgi:hypothetical protein
VFSLAKQNLCQSVKSVVPFVFFVPFVVNFLNFVFWSFKFVSDFEFRISDFLWLLISSKSQEVQKKCSKHAQNMLVSVSFCSKRARFC